MVSLHAEVAKEDTGDWSIEIANDNGVCNVNFPFAVRATPGHCRAPLKVSDTTFTTAQLSWGPPTDDGGSRVTHYVIEKKETGKSYWTTVSSQVKLTKLFLMFKWVHVSICSAEISICLSICDYFVLN